jgi:uncharacterized protein
MRWSSKLSIATIFSIAVGQSQAASFDCKKAITKTEKTICQSEELSSLDETIAKNYIEYLGKGIDPNAKSTQKAWISLQQSCNGRYKCLKWVYKEWVKEFYFSPYKELIDKPNLDFPYSVKNSFDWRTCGFGDDGLFTCSSSLTDWDNKYQACSTGLNVYQLISLSHEPKLQVWRNEQAYLKGEEADDVMHGSFDIQGTGPCRHTLAIFEQYKATISFFQGCGPSGEDEILYPSMTMFEITERTNNKEIEQGACRALAVPR